MNVLVVFVALMKICIIVLFFYESSDDYLRRKRRIYKGFPHSGFFPGL